MIFNPTKKLQYILFSGGLGNQMFQYAFGQYLHHMHGVPIAYDCTFYDLQDKRAFDLSLFHCSDFIKTKKTPQIIKSSFWKKPSPIPRITEKNFRFQKTNHHSFNNAQVFDGYWQSYLYLEPIKSQLLKDFTFKSAPSESNTEWCKKYQDATLICLHIRRGDYVSEEKTNEFHGVLPITYYENAIKKFTSLSNPVIFIFTDDPNWAKQELKFEIKTEFISHSSRSMKDDFELMQTCHKFIIANSSFSWWAAYLSQAQRKEVIYPDPWFRDLSIDTQDLCPPEWVKLSIS